ncbi:MAG TPA: PTS sugar transporter subunit IIA [Syntrophales bacterium]|nr:PTS sugar transporter subunit IIA [Syntrophales bacterium]HOL59822.1 PTS sugar transporter subunit IIA [Syntrophales bacterium]HPO35960.1 PTS sugar transporter subunit IIA [Syntrophales bacterium]
MKLTEMMGPGCIIGSLEVKNKEEALRELTRAALHDISPEELEGVVKVLLDREKLGSTGIGDGTAIPHGKVSTVDSMKVAFGRSLKGIDFNALDGKPVFLFFLLLAPEGSQSIHLRVLAKISRMVRDASFRTRLMGAKDSKELYEIISKQDECC